MLRKLLLVCCLLFPFIVNALPDTLRLSIDSLPVSINRNWQFIRSDDPAMATTGYNDAGWKTMQSTLPVIEDKDTTVTETCWLRRHIIIDTSLAGLPIAVHISQAGASVFYVDGKKAATFGTISADGNNTNYNPHGTPFIIVFSTPGHHVFAVRYANNDAISNDKRLGKSLSGIFITLADANKSIPELEESLIMPAKLLLTLLGAFTALGIVHLLLFLYHREERSNLYFSIFNLAVAICLAFTWITMADTDPRWYNTVSLLSIIFLSLCCWSMSGFINELFSRGRLRFRIITALCILVIIIRYIHYVTGMISLMALIGIVCVEAFVLIISALFRKIKGARIIGAGLFLLISMLLFMLISILFTGNFEMNQGSIISNVFGILFYVAVLSVPVSISAFLAWRFAGLNKDLKTQLTQVQVLSAKTREQEQEQKRLLETRQEELEKEVAARTAEVRKQHDELKSEKKKSDDLLLNILPAEVAEELKENGMAKARLYDEVTVLFTDFVNFTGISEMRSPAELVAELDYCFRAFDEIITRHGMEKIKTIGDAYLAVSGLPVAHPGHAVAAVNAALEIRNFIELRKQQTPAAFSIRLGIHSGPVVAGIVGIKKFAYDIWGDTVNTAARMEQHSESGRINISEATYQRVKNEVPCTYRGDLEAKNKGKMSMYFAG